MHARFIVSTICICLFAGAGALAQTSTRPLVSVKPDFDPAVSITVSPLHLLNPFLKLDTEVGLSDKLSATAIIGAGAQGGLLTAEGGIQFRYYVLGSFAGGLHVGAEGLFGSHTDLVTDRSVRVVPEGLAIGPFTGLKYVFNFGLTLDILGGLQLLASKNKVEGEDTSGTPIITKEAALGLLANLNVGWSF